MPSRAPGRAGLESSSFHCRWRSAPRPEVVHALSQGVRRVRKSVHRRGKGLEGKGASIALVPQPANLALIVQPVGGVDENAMRIAHIRDGQVFVDDAGDVYEAGEIRK